MTTQQDQEREAFEREYARLYPVTVQTEGRMNAAERIIRQLAEKQADDRAHKIATMAADEYIRTNGIQSDTPDEFIFHGDELADEHFQECIAHLKWHGQCMTFEMADESMSVMLGDYTLESLA